MSTDYARTRQSGWLEFAAIMLYVAAGIYFLWALNLFADSHWAHQVTYGVFANHLWTWGLWDLGMAFLFAYAGYDLWTQAGGFGRWVALIAASVSIVRWLYWVPFAPLAGFTIIVLDVLIIYGVLTTWGGADRRAAAQP